MKVLALPRYDPAGASSRYRLYQFLPRLRAAGLEVDDAPLVDHRYIDQLYRGRRASPTGLARAALARIGRVLAARAYDLVWIEKELLPFVPGWLEWLLQRSGVPVVVDYDDATFHRYDQHPSAAVRALLGRKIGRVMASASLVTAGNSYLAEHARAAGARTVEVLPTVIDLERYPRAAPATRDPLVVGWIGSPSTQKYLRHVAPALARFCRERGARVHAIGADKGFTLEGVPLEVVPWTEAGELEALRALDIGIMPLHDSPWERGKCGFKLIQYMACSLPVIASGVGANRDIVTHGETGFLAESEAEWLTALTALADSAETRRRMGGAGRARVESSYSVQAIAPRLIDLLLATARRAHRAAGGEEAERV